MSLSHMGKMCRTSVFLILCALAGGGVARERGPRVEVICPSRPVPFPLDQRMVLVYELHVTNFDSVPLELKRIEIFANAPGRELLQSLAGASLPAATVVVGGSSTAGGEAISPGARAVVFLWIDLAANLPVPGSLRHRMTFSAPEKGGSGSPDAVLEDYPVSVSREKAPTLGLPFRGGVWVAGDGPANDSPHRRTIIAIDGSLHSAERFAIDWIKVGPNGDSHHGGDTRNENWWGYGEPVLAVADGEITEVVDDIPENKPRALPNPVTLDNIAGNHLTHNSHRNSQTERGEADN